MSHENASLHKTAFIGTCADDPVPLPFDELVAHEESVRECITQLLHREHLVEPNHTSLVAIQSAAYAFNYKALARLVPDLFHESGAVVLRQLWEVSLNLHWIEGDAA